MCKASLEYVIPTKASFIHPRQLEEEIKLVQQTNEELKLYKFSKSLESD